MKYIAFGKEKVENVRFLMVVLLEMCDVVVKVNKLYVLFKNKVVFFFGFFFVKYLLKMCCQSHTLSIPSSRNFIEENRLKKSTHHTMYHTMGGVTVKNSLIQLLKCLKIHVLCART